MKLIDLKRPKKTKKEMEVEIKGASPMMEEGDRYPYGLNLRFEKEEIDKIEPLQSVKADAEVQFTGTGFVKLVETTDASEKAENWRRSRKTVEVQVTTIAIEPKSQKNLSEMDNEEYRQARQNK